MSIIHGIGDEVAWFAVAIAFITIILSVSFLWTAFIAQSGIHHQSISNPNEELQQTADSSVGESENNQVECGVNHDACADDSLDGRTDDGVDGRTEELNSCNEDEVVVVENCSENIKAEHNSIKTSGVSDSLSHENLQQTCSSTVVRRILTTSENSSTEATNTSPSVRNETSAPSATSPTSETERTYSDQILIRIKYLNDMERTVNTRLSKVIADFKRDHFSEELAANKTVRLIFNGQLLRNEVSLQQYGISDGCVVHVHISQTDPQRPLTIIDSNVDLDLSHLLWPLLSVILILLWILYFKYPQFFNVTSTGILLVFTGGFIFVYSENRLQTRN